MPKPIRKGAGAKFSIILLSIFILLFITSSVAFADPGKLGDVNEDGEVDVRDVVLVMRHVLEIEELDEEQERWADVDGDGEIDVRDTTLIMQYALGIIDEFPYDLPEVLSVKAIDRETIEVVLSEDVAEDVAEDPEYYEVTVDDETIEVEDVDYDADDLIAELEVDLEDKSGVLVVNGVEAEEEVPPLPEYTGVSAVEGSKEIELYFNTAVYAKDDLDEDDIEVRVGGKEDVGIDEFGFEDSKDDAEDTATIEVDERPSANDSVVVHILSDGAEKIVNIWEEAIEEDVESTTATPDEENPTFDDIIAFEDSQFILAIFSEPVNTTGTDEDEDDGEQIEVGIGDDQVRVTGERADGSPMGTINGDGIAAVDRDDEQETLRIEIDKVIPEGAEMTVSFGADAGEQIVDRAKNRLAGTYTRTTTAVEGPTLEDASASDLGSKTEDQTQTFEVTLVGDMDEDAELTIDVSEAINEGVEYSIYSWNYDVDGADGSVGYDDDDDKIVFEPDETIDDGTTITIEADNVDTGDAAEDIEVTFERSEVGATITAEFDVLAGLSDISIEPEYELEDAPTGHETVELLASGKEDHTIYFKFTVEDELEEDEAIEIDVSNLIDAGVDFDGEISIDEGDAEVELDNDTIIVTADNGTIDEEEDIVVKAEEVNVDEGSAADDLEVDFTRTDSGLTLTKEIDIAASFSEVEVTDIVAEDYESVRIRFTLDGDLDTFPRTVRVFLDWEEEAGLGFEELDSDDVDVYPTGTASMDEDGVVRYRPGEDLEHGTMVEIEIYDAIHADGLGGDHAYTMFRREDSRYKATDKLEID